MQGAVFVLCGLCMVQIVSLAAPLEPNGTPSQVRPPEGVSFQGTAETPLSNTNWHEMAWRTHQVEQQQATTTQTRKGRATSSPSKKIPRPCPGCFSVIGDPLIGAPLVGDPPTTRLG